MNKTHHHIISDLFSAPIVSFFTALVIVYAIIKNIFSIQSFILILFSSLIPLFLLVYYYYTGQISDFYASNKEERTKLFLIAIVSYFIGALVFYYLRAPLFLFAFMLAQLAVTLTLYVVNFEWKISIHTASYAGYNIAWYFIVGKASLLLFPLILLIGYSRYKLNAHTISQLISGAVVGTLISVLTYTTVLY